MIVRQPAICMSSGSVACRDPRLLLLSGVHLMELTLAASFLFDFDDDDDFPFLAEDFSPANFSASADSPFNGDLPLFLDT